jgi:hypothetical protein
MSEQQQLLSKSSNAPAVSSIRSSADHLSREKQSEIELNSYQSVPTSSATRGAILNRDSFYFIRIESEAFFHQPAQHLLF